MCARASWTAGWTLTTAACPCTSWARPADGRHTYASLLIHEGRSPLLVSAALGHASGELVWRRYGHVFAEARLASMSSMVLAIEEAREAVGAPLVTGAFPRLRDGSVRWYRLLTGLRWVRTLGRGSSQGGSAMDDTSSLTLDAGTYEWDGNTCWGTLSGSGLASPGTWLVQDLDGRLIMEGSTDAVGTISVQLNLPCVKGYPAIMAGSQKPDGEPIATPVVSPPDCWQDA